MKFYNIIEKLRMNAPPYNDPFIVQMEIPYDNSKENNAQDRVYVVFDGVEEYVRCYNKGRFQTCHEVFLSSTLQPDDDIVGHPAFDIDVKLTEDTDPVTLLPKSQSAQSWIELFQKDVIDVLCSQYPQSSGKIRYSLTDSDHWVWMTSNSTGKVSKHLVIKNIIFSMWRSQMKTLCSELKKLDRPYSSAIDDGILRKLGSLRLPLNSKALTRTKVEQLGTLRVEMPKLVFDSYKHKFTDGLVMIHDANSYTAKDGILLMPSDLTPELQDKCSYVIPDFGDYEEYDIDCTSELGQAFSVLESRYRTGLTLGASKGRYLTLIRKSPGKCPISGKVHDSDNAYLIENHGKIYFGCYRKCTVNIEGVERKVIDITPYSALYSESAGKIIAEKLKSNADSG